LRTISYNENFSVEGIDQIEADLELTPPAVRREELLHRTRVFRPSITSAQSDAEDLETNRSGDGLDSDDLGESWRIGVPRPLPARGSWAVRSGAKLCGHPVSFLDDLMV
jgi:hypothetical protein